MNPKNNISRLNLPKKDYCLNSPNSALISPFIEEGEFLDYKPKINNNYTIENFEYLKDYNNEKIIIGKGGYGQLYLAINKKDGKEYAIKNVSKEKMKAVGVDISIIKREIDIHIRITHPHIIKLISYSEDRHNFYLVMEYAHKGNLYKFIQQKRGMDEDEAFHYFIQVASAIHFLHFNGFAHRDIKPENILLDKNGSVKLCDFGWCVNVSKGNRITFCGTYEYMAPEMINDEFYDMGIDIWSLGVLLYEMIHGYSPFRAHHFLKDAKSAMKEIFRNIKSNNYSIDKNISEECIDLIDKLLTTDTKKRIKINELFAHPWVIKKVKDYFPHYNTLININNKTFYRCKGSNISNHQDQDKEIKNNNYSKEKNDDSNNYKIIKMKENNNIRKDIINKEKENNIKKENSKKHVKNKSFCFVINKGNSKNNGIYFIKEKSGNRQKREQYDSRIEKEKDKKDFENNNNEKNISINNFNNYIYDKYKIKEEEFNSPRIEKKEQDSKNNFIFTIKSKSKILDLSKENKKDIKRSDKKGLIEWENLDNNNNLNKYERYHRGKKNEGNEIIFEEKERENYLKSASNKKILIRVKQKEMDNYIKTENKSGSNLYINIHNKISNELNLNNTRKKEEKKRRGESLSKTFLKENVINSYDNNPLSQSQKFQYTFIYNKPRKDIGSYTIKKFSPIKKKNNIITKDNKVNIFLTNRENLKNRRAKSMQQSLNEISNTFQENKLIKNILRQRKNNNMKKNLMIKNFDNNCENNYIDNEDYAYTNLNTKEEEFQLDEIIPNKEHFKRFRKKVVHFKKKLYINSEGNLIKSQNYIEKNKDKNEMIKSYCPQTNIKSNKSIQNVFYNTFYNCLFDNLPNNNNNNHIDNNNETCTNNFYIKNNNNINNYKSLQKNHSENLLYYKAFSNEKNHYKNIAVQKKYGYSKKLKVIDERNKVNDLINFHTEKKIGKIYRNKIDTENENNNEKYKFNYIYFNGRNKLINTSRKHSPSNIKGKELIVSSFN